LANSQKVSIALIGAGRIGQIHAVNLATNPRVHFAAIIEPDDSGKSLADRYGVKNWFKTLAEAVEHEKKNGLLFSAVFICTPTHTHTPIIREALNADKNVVCEKPIAHDVGACDGIMALAKEKNKFMLTGFHRRYDPHFSAVRDAVRSGQLGKLLKVRSTSRDCPVPTLDYLKISGGIIHDCCSHDLDLIRWTIGENPIKVFVAATCHDPDIKALDDFDCVDISLFFSNGVLGQVDVTRKSIIGYDQRLEALGDTGIANSYNQARNPVVIGTSAGFHHAPIQYSFDTRYVDAYKGELNHFLDLCTGVTSVMAFTAEELHSITKILDACIQSAKTGQIVTVDYS